MLNTVFEKIYFINLDRRPDRLEQVMAEFEKHEIKNAHRISAVDKNTLADGPAGVDRGNVACARSHLQVVKDAKRLGLKNYLVLEDDVVFHPDFNKLLEAWYDQVPENYDLLYLGANHNSGVEYVSPNVCKCIASYTTHAYAASANVYDAMIDLWTNQDAEIDVCLARLHKFYNCYCFIPNLAYQRNGYSDIAEKECDYDFLHNNRQTTDYGK